MEVQRLSSWPTCQEAHREVPWLRCVRREGRLHQLEEDVDVLLLSGDISKVLPLESNDSR